MKDKVSPMRTVNAKSADSIDMSGEKNDMSINFIKPDQTTAVSHGEERKGAQQKADDAGDKETLDVLEGSSMIELRGSMQQVEPVLCSGHGLEELDGEVIDCIPVDSPNHPDDSVDGSVSAPTQPCKLPPSIPKKLPSNFMKGESKWKKLRTIVKTTTVVKQKTKRKSNLQRQDSFLKKFSTRQQRGDTEEEMPDEDDNDYKWRDQTAICAVIHPDGTFMFYWLAIVTIAVLYNWWTCIAREGFREIQDGWEAVWFTFDGVCDTIYVMDIVVQFRTGYLEQGLMVYDVTKLRQNYYKSSNFYFDIAALFPLDIIQVFIGIHPMIRFPRFLKTYRTLRFMYMLESRAAYPNLFRVANLTHLLFLGSHWFAAFYYLISEAEGFVGDWAYPYPSGEFSSVTRKYLMSLYWSTLTLTTIGDLPPPDSNWEYVFVIVSYLIGVFVFATIVGQVGNVITNRNASRQEFEKLLDGAKSYMRMHNVPPDLQKRVQRWYDYVWSRGRLNGSWDINSLGLLPDKLKTELALHVNLETLKKVTIFQECQPEFLHDLVLKMKAYIFTPGDLICRSGEIAREMFIIADGVVEVISESGTVLTQMSTGDFFGEIGILNLDGGINRRTADVRSVGYSELFVLSREDVLSALKDHRDAEKILKDLGRKRLKELGPRKSIAVQNIGVTHGNEKTIFKGDNDKAPSFIRVASPAGMESRAMFGHQGLQRFVALKIIHDYGQKRLQEIEADRQKIKPKSTAGDVDEEETDDEIDDSLLSPLKRHVRFNSYSPVIKPKPLVVLETKPSERRKSCSVEYYRPRPVNGLVNFLQRKLSVGSAFCGVFQNPQIANQARVLNPGVNDPLKRTSSCDGSNDSVAYEAAMRGILSKGYDFYSPTEDANAEQLRQASMAPPLRHGFKGVHYNHLATEEASDSESGVYASGLPDQCKLLPVEETLNDETRANASLNALASPHASSEGNTSASDAELKFPCVFSKSENSTKIANAFLQHLVNSRTDRRKSHDGGVDLGQGALERSKFGIRRKSAYDCVEVGFPFRNRLALRANMPVLHPPVPTVAVESFDDPPNCITSASSPTSGSLHFTPAQALQHNMSSIIDSSNNSIALCCSVSNHSLNQETKSTSASRRTPSPYNLLALKPHDDYHHDNSSSLSPSSAVKHQTLPGQNKSSLGSQSPSKEFRVEKMMGDVQTLIVDKMSDIAEGYMSKVRQLEEENREKEDKIQELELKVRDLQIELSMAVRENKS